MTPSETPDDRCEQARKLLQVKADATPQEVEAAFASRLHELRIAMLDLGGFVREAHNSGWRLDNFIVGDGNCAAYEQVRQVCSRRPACNPLYLYGSPGSGKTHLLHAISNILNRRGLALLHSAQTFSEEMVQSVARGRLTEFREKYRQLDAFLLDDVHALDGRSRTQQEAFYLIHHLVAQGSQVVLAGQSGPEEMAQGLRHRLGPARCFEVGYLNLAERKALIKQKALETGLELGTDVVNYLARHFTTDVRDIEGSLQRFASRIGHLPQTGVEAQAILFPLHAPSEQRPLTVGDVQSAVAAHFHLDTGDLRSPKGNHKIKRARQIAIYLCSQLCPGPCDDIALLFGAEPRQVGYAVRKVKDLLTDPLMSEDIRHITEALT